jgi:cyclophilin family peptidyl-prolyl cis-trans isomerase
LVDKPGRRKKKTRPWKKIGAVVVAALVIVGVGYWVYGNYFYQPPPVYARLGTSFGYIYAELYPACAPKTVSNFVDLANAGTYTDLVWHRIVDKSTPAFVIQTGDPNTKGGVNSTRYSWGQGSTPNTVPLEFCGWLHNYAGYLGEARGSDPNSGSSQFYINLSNGSANLGLDPSYAVFGKVLSGMSVVCQIAYVKVYPANSTQNDASGHAVSIADQPITPVFLNNVTIISAAQAPSPQPITACK